MRKRRNADHQRERQRSVDRSLGVAEPEGFRTTHKHVEDVVDDPGRRVGRKTREAKRGKKGGKRRCQSSLFLFFELKYLLEPMLTLKFGLCMERSSSKEREGSASLLERRKGKTVKQGGSSPGEKR